MNQKTIDILMYGDEKVVDLDEPYTVYNANLIPDEVEEARDIYTASPEDIQRGIDFCEIDGRQLIAEQLIEFVFEQFSAENKEWQNVFFCII